MKLTPEYIKAFGILSLCGFASYGIWVGADVLKAQKGVAERLEAAARTGTQEWLDRKVVPLVDARTAEVLEIARQTATQTTAILSRLERHADQRVGQVVTIADSRLQETTGAIAQVAGSLDTVARSIPPLTASVGGAVEDLRPGFRNLSLMAQDARQAIEPQLQCKGNAACWPSQVTGIMGASKMLLGEAALTTRTWRKESPAIAASVREITGTVGKLSKRKWYVEAVKIAVPVAAGVIIGRQVKK